MPKTTKTEASKEASFLQQNKKWKFLLIGLAFITVISIALAATFGIKYANYKHSMNALANERISLKIDVSVPGVADDDYLGQAADTADINIPDISGYYGRTLADYLKDNQDKFKLAYSPSLGYSVTQIMGYGDESMQKGYWMLGSTTDSHFQDEGWGVGASLIYLQHFNEFSFTYTTI